MKQPAFDIRGVDARAERPRGPRLARFSALTLPTGLVACGGGSGSESPAPTPAPTTPVGLDCSSLQFSATSARPGAAVIVSGGSAFGIDSDATVEVSAASGRKAVTGGIPEIR